MNIRTFNELPINSIFVWGYKCVFVKTRNAIPGVGMSVQPSNCVSLHNRHFCTMTADHKCIEVIQPDKLPKLKGINTLKPYEVWMEGYACTGESAPHRFLGSVEAENFDFACYLAVLNWCLKFGDGVDDFNTYYNPKTNSYWGCKCYSNEKDSMYFG